LEIWMAKKGDWYVWMSQHKFDFGIKNVEKKGFGRNINVNFS